NRGLRARCGNKLLGGGEPAGHGGGVREGRGCNTGPRQRPATGLVTARDWPDAALERRALTAECRPGFLLPKRQADWACAGDATHAAMVRSTRRKSMRK